ncbi:RNA-binding domain-containing protein [Arenibacter algicola]|uniref:RNA-binding domain-containing protein n=1 Tax=Arenibacter algicola TaxID=616991 RepID=UPI0004DF5936|nr:RNA-binding domain-containing protein [Arenibacter algicola]
MTAERLQAIIDQGESVNVEFKTSSIALNKDAFDSICGFLNRSGGHLLLGVQNDGAVSGVHEDKVQGIIDGLVANANNPQKLNPPYYVSPEVLDMNGKKVIVVYVPESSQVHATKGRIYDRNQDGDFDITNQQDQVSQLYLRKQNSYSENQVYPYVELSDFKESLFEKVRNLARNQQPKHPWLAMTNEELLRSVGLYKKDMKTGQSGYTLAAVLLFGKDETIQSVVPHYKTDALARIENKDRYDDRDDIRTNLFESYDRLMAFVAKHLSEKFHLINTQRINVRDNLFREVIANLLVHREYTNPFPAKFIIEANQVRAENWNKPHGSGNIDPANFSPYPKNPIIAKLFKEIGWVDELGSGVRNTYKYTELYTPGAKPTFTEGDVFEIIIPLSEKASEETSEKVSGKTSEKIITLLKEDNKRTAKELSKIIGVSDRAIEKQIAKLQQQGKLTRVGSDKAGHWKVMN